MFLFVMLLVSGLFLTLVLEKEDSRLSPPSDSVIPLESGLSAPLGSEINISMVLGISEAITPAGTGSAFI